MYVIVFEQRVKCFYRTIKNGKNYKIKKFLKIRNFKYLARKKSIHIKYEGTIIYRGTTQFSKKIWHSFIRNEYKTGFPTALKFQKTNSNENFKFFYVKMLTATDIFSLNDIKFYFSFSKLLYIWNPCAWFRQFDTYVTAYSDSN